MKKARRERSEAGAKGAGTGKKPEEAPGRRGAEEYGKKNEAASSS